MPILLARARYVMLVVAVALLFSTGEGAAAPEGRPSKRSEQQQKEVQSLLKRINKPPLASIESPDGDIIDCVNISKQPAFDHPLLKNHTIQMQPSYHPSGMNYEFKDASQPVLTQMWHQNGKCPEDTIPIQRTTEEDVLRASSVISYGKKWPKSIPNTVSRDHDELDVTAGHQHAVASTVKGKYHGTNASFNVWQPKLAGPNDFSLAQLWISAGSYETNELNTIEAGWQVSQQIYGDDNSRLFIFWTHDTYKSGCYNLKCPGFMQTNNQIALGSSISPVSIYDGSQYDMNIFIWKDPNDGKWWLQVNNQVLGYWPSSIFSNLADSASMVMWGGEVYSPGSSQTSTQMGSGHFPKEGFRKASYIKDIQVMDWSNDLKSPDEVNLLTEKPNCYKVQNDRNSQGGTYIYYGGAGKNSNCM